MPSLNNHPLKNLGERLIEQPPLQPPGPARDASDDARRAYLRGRSFAIFPSFVTSLSMVMIGGYCLENDVRMGSAWDVAQTRQTIFLNAAVLVILMMLCRSDHSSQWMEELIFTEWMIERAPYVNRIAFCFSFVSLAMPLNGVLAAYLYPHVPVTNHVELPGWLNGLFIFGAFCYIVVLIWFMGSSMSRPVRETWALRQDLIKNMKEAKNQQDWTKLCKRLAEVDGKLNKAWDITNAGLIWCTVTIGSMVLALVGMFNIITKSSGADVLSYFEAALDDLMALVYFVVGTLFTLLLGLILSSTAFVAPFGPGNNCVVNVAILECDDQICENANASNERMRFTHCATIFSLSAKLCGVHVTKDMVMRLFLQIGIVMPTFFSVLHSMGKNIADAHQTGS